MKAKGFKFDRARRAFLGMSLAVAVGLPVVARGDGPTSRPAGDADTANPFPRRQRGGGGPGNPFRSSPGDEQPPSAEKWNETAAFMKQYSPYKWEMFQNLPDRDWKQGLQGGIYTRYQELKRLEGQDPDRYTLELARVRIEDDIFGLLATYRKSRSEEDKARLRERVAALVDNRQALRRLRLNRVENELGSLRMNQSLEAVQKEWNAEASRRDEMIERRLDDFLQHAQPRGRRGGPDGFGDRERGERGGPRTPPDGAPTSRPFDRR